jgi:hypothetical protein
VFRWNKLHLRRTAIVIARHGASKDALPSGRATAKQSRGTKGAQRSLDCFVATLLAMTISSEPSVVVPYRYRFSRFS